jgi:large conductance mechanosensitive channel
MRVVSEFKAFALKGNVMDLAVGVIIGAAFGKSCILAKAASLLQHLVLNITLQIPVLQYHNVIQLDNHYE